MKMFFFFMGGGGVRQGGTEILGVWVQLGGLETSVRSRGGADVNQVRNTLLMHIACNLYIKMVTLGSPGSCSTGIKVTSAELSQSCKAGQPSSCMSFIITQFAHESFRICHFCGSCMREYDLI